MFRRLKRWLARRPRTEITCRQAGHNGGVARRTKEQAHYRSTAIKLANHINRPDLAEPLNEKRDLK